MDTTTKMKHIKSFNEFEFVNESKGKLSAALDRAVAKIQRKVKATFTPKAKNYLGFPAYRIDSDKGALLEIGISWDGKELQLYKDNGDSVISVAQTNITNVDEVVEKIKKSLGK